MTERSNTELRGGDGGNAFGARSCPDGEIINRIYGGAGDNLDRVCASCSDGTDLGCVGGGGGGGYSYTGPFTSISGRSGAINDRLISSGGSGGNPYTSTCPSGKYIVGYQGRAGALVDKLGFICGVKKSEYCINNLEQPLCRNVDAGILNQACKVNMTDTCRNRKEELDETVIQSFCASHPNDDFCSCYTPAPAYIDDIVKGLGQCWNQTCATKGFIPRNMRKDCPNITICKQALPVDGTGNVLTKNVQVLECGSTHTTQTGSGSSADPPATKSPTQSGTSSNPATSLTPAQIAVQQATAPDDTSLTSLFSNPIIWIILVVILGFGIYKFTQSDPQMQMPMPMQQMQMQQMQMPMQQMPYYYPMQ